MSVVCEQGFAGASVASVCARAGVSRGSFYELFDGREDCFLAVIDDAYRLSSALIAGAFERAEDWRDGVRRALAELLLLFDREPGLARVWLVETLGAGSWALERRSRHVTALTRQVVESWPQPLGAGPHPLASVSVMASLLGILQTHALAEEPEPMITLLGPLMGVVVAPYLDPPAVEQEIERGAALARQMLAALAPGGGRPTVPVADALHDPRAYRARGCLRYLATNPGASNRQIADAIGVRSHSQISTLLARLARAGLVHNRPGRPGHANAWSLTPSGLHALDTHTSHTSRTPVDLHVTS